MSSNIYIPAKSPDDWQRFLAEPDKQWKKGYSARAVAHSWHAAEGLPQEIAAFFSRSDIEAFQKVEVLLAIPEHKVPLPPARGHPSQNDVFALLKSGDGNLVSMTVEAKVSESFDRTVGEWIRDGSTGKQERFDFIRQMLDLQEQDLGGIRYQLLHRLISAIIEAKRFNTAYAVMVVQSFSPTNEWFEDYVQFMALFDVEAAIGKLYPLGVRSNVQVFSGWAHGDQNFLAA